MELDKLLHSLICFSITLTLLPVIGYWAILISATVAVLKELYDWFKYGKKMGWVKLKPLAKGDLIADSIGIFIGVVVWITLF